jgi:DNA repair ATPase RecN
MTLRYPDSHYLKSSNKRIFEVEEKLYDVSGALDRTNVSVTTLATSVSQLNASVTTLNNVSFNLNQLSSRIDTQNTVKLVCNDISCNQIFCTQVFTTSDLNKKNNIVSCDLGMDFMDTLRPVSFTYTDNPDKVFYGFVAQEVKAALELDDKVPERYGLWTEEQDTQFLSLQELISPLVKSLQEVHARLRQVEAQLQAQVETR